MLTDLHDKLGPQVPSYSTFRRRWKSHWSHMLRMRQRSQHQQCQICFDLQLALRDGKMGWQKKLEAAKLLRLHQADQYRDRLLYWSMRYASQVQSSSPSQASSPAVPAVPNCGSASVLTIIIDDMDHSKFAWPRWPFRKQPHELDGMIRPTVTFTGAIAHGWGTFLYMAGPQMHGGADYFLEVLSQTIEQVWRMCEQSNGQRTFPANLVVIADNTVKSAKNQQVLRYLAYLVGKKIFRSATLLLGMSNRKFQLIQC